MRIRLFALFAVALFAQVPGLLAQETDSTEVWQESPNAQQTIVIVGEKSPFAAGALSAFVLPGAGSFYAGNSRHGIAHLAVAAASFGGIISDGGECAFFFSLGSSDGGGGCTVVAISAGVFIVNWIWSIGTGVSDAKAYNRSIREKGLQIAPEIVAIRSDGRSTLGLQVLRFGI